MIPKHNRETIPLFAEVHDFIVHLVQTATVATYSDALIIVELVARNIHVFEEDNRRRAAAIKEGRCHGI